jgi:hypothetical protein
VQTSTVSALVAAACSKLPHPPTSPNCRSRRGTKILKLLSANSMMLALLRRSYDIDQVGAAGELRSDVSSSLCRLRASPMS